MAYADTLPKQRPFGATTRPDAWWLQPLAVFLGFSAFIVYSTWAAFQGVSDIHNHVCTYWFGGLHGENGGANYLSPFYSPEFWGVSPHAIGTLPAWWPGWLPFSPAFLILWAPAGFRFTCYYYRGAYYKAFWADPVNCAVGEPRKTYLGERYFPLIIQNIHRYMFYIAAIFIVILSYDAWLAMWFTDATGKEHFGIGVGTIVMILNAVFLGLYTFGCHSLRHLIGGFLDSKSKAPTCGKAYNCVSCLNRKHMMWAWISLFWVGFTDVYIRLCAMGKIHDNFLLKPAAQIASDQSGSISIQANSLANLFCLILVGTLVFYISRFTANKVFASKGSNTSGTDNVSTFIAGGLVVGMFVGFLLRPSAPLIGQLPFIPVITRGMFLEGLDQVLISSAKTSFNYLFAGCIVGSIAGFLAAKVLAANSKH